MPGPPPSDAQRVPGPDPQRHAGPLTAGAPLLAIVGPTGTGKSEVAVRVAERLGGEIIGCDALQVYRGLDAATAKPPVTDRARVPYHLIDEADPRTDFSLADYVARAEAAASDIVSRGRVPLVVGGTGLYLRGLLRGIVRAPARDPRLRSRLGAMAQRHGSGRLHRWLRSLDPASAERLPPADTQRILRAIEIALKSPSTWSETLRVEGTWSEASERYRSLKIALDMDRERLCRRLDRRVSRFFESGLVEEMARLIESGVPRDANAFKGIGYREVLAAIERGADPFGVIDDVRRNTRRYAKRQKTWFRKEPDVIWLDGSRDAEGLSAEIARLWHEKFADRPPATRG